MAIMITRSKPSKQFIGDQIDSSLSESYKRRQTEILIEIQSKHVIQIANQYGFDPVAYNNLLNSTHNPVLIKNLAGHLYRGLLSSLNTEFFEEYLDRFDNDAVLALHELVLSQTNLFSKYPAREILNLLQLTLFRMEQLRSNMLNAARQTFVESFACNPEIHQDIRILKNRMCLKPRNIINTN